MRYLTEQQIQRLHNKIIEETGGSTGIRDAGLLDAAIARPQASFGGEDLYITVFTKAAALLESIAMNHPFVDGNKRTAAGSAALTLRINGWKLSASEVDLEDFVVDVVVRRPSIDEIAEWLEANSRPHPFAIK